ncbi:MAG: hypothetical protein LBK95_19040 [Bifidobacteriaceae bacterium]|jgi:hypothetical protein|nr:hypothetical protein [Bifidobacteriaceae bacterium]
MPTSLPRHAITETRQIAAAIDLGASNWPGARGRADVARLLLLEGAESLRRRRYAERASREAALTRWAGAMPGVFPPGAVATLHEEWPA